MNAFATGPSGSTGQTFTIGAAAVAVDSGVTATSFDTDLTGASLTIANYQSGDALNFANQNGISGSYSAGVLTLSGSATPAQYTAALQSVTFSTTNINTTIRTIDVVALDANDTGNVSSNTGVDTVAVAIPPPVVTASGNTNTFIVGGSALAVDAGLTVTSYDTDLTGATETITDYHSGDSLNFVNQNGITGSYSAGVLTLSGSATPAQYQAALQSVTFSTTSTTSTSRSVSIVAIDGSLDSNPVAEQINVEFTAVTASGLVNNFFLNGTAATIDSGIMVAASDPDLTGATVTISPSTLQPGDTLNFANQYGISGVYSGGVLTLSGDATVAQYQAALQSVTFSTVNSVTSANLITRSITVVALDANDSLNGSAAESINVVIATVNPSGQTNTFITGGAAVPLDSQVTVESSQEGLNGATLTITDYQPGDMLNYTPVDGILGTYSNGTLTLDGDPTPAEYAAALQSVTFSTTSPDTALRVISVDVSEESANGTEVNSPFATLDVAAPAAPVVTPGGTTTIFWVGGSPVPVDSGVTVKASDLNLTGASMIDTDYTPGDLLSIPTIDLPAGVTQSFSGGVLTLNGSAAATLYQTALQSVMFSATYVPPGGIPAPVTRMVEVIADDSLASPMTSNTAMDSVTVKIAAPVVTANQTSVEDTAGQRVTVDAPVTVSSFDTDVTGATMTIGTGYQQGDDTLSFTNQSGISGSYSNSTGVLTLSGSATPAQYQQALASVTFSSTSTVTTTRNISMVVYDAGATVMTSNPATTQIEVNSPVTVAAVYVSGSAWTDGGASTDFDGYLANHGLGSLTDPSLGYALTGTNQLAPLPWVNINTISVQFSGPVENIGMGSLELVGGSGGSTPTITSFTPNPNGDPNTYSWTFSGSLANNKYVLAIATTGSSFGTPGSTQVTDFDRAAISGAFTTGASFPSGNGLAGGSFNFLFNVLPGDGGQVGTVNSADVTTAGNLNGKHESTPGYLPNYDYYGAGQITNALDQAFDTSNLGATLPTPAPAAPSISLALSNNTVGYTPGGAAVPLGITIAADVELTGATVTISPGTLQSGDTLHFATQNGISGVYSGGVLTLTGSATPAQYQQALASVTFSSTSAGAARSISIVAIDDDGLSSNSVAVSAKVAIAAPVVSTSGSTGQTFTLGGSAVAVDSGISVTSSDTDITGASETITNYQSGDSLNYTPSGGITIASNSGGVLTLIGSATPAQYTVALQSITFSTTSINQSTRTIDVLAGDSATSPTTSNTGIDTVKVAIAAPVVTANQASVASTAGQAVTVDSAVTVKSFDTDVTGATMTIGTGYQSGSDTLHFATQNGITGSYSAGVLTLSGSATPAQYQTALQSVTFSSTSSSVATRNISIVVDDSGDTGNVNSNTATIQITVSPPVTVTAAYISSTAWASGFYSYLAGHTNPVTGNSYGSATYGYALQTGSSAAQTQTLPWTNLNAITVTFSGPVSGVALGSLKLNGGSGGSTPSVTGFTSDGSNTYSWTLSGPLTNNKYALGIASTNSSFGPAVVDSHGAGISGTFTTGQAFPSGNGLAGSTFDFFFDVLPGDTNRDGQDNATDINDIRPLSSGTRSTSASYNPYYDLFGSATINATTLNTSRPLTGRLESANPTAPSDSQGVGFVGLELEAQETGGSTSLAAGGSSTASSQPSSSPTAAVSNVVPSKPASNATSVGTVVGFDSDGSSTTLTSTASIRDHDGHYFMATDEALSDFDLVDLWV